MTGILTASFLMIFVVFTFILYVYILIDILKHKFNGYNKIVWLIIILFFSILGGLLYLVFGKGQKIKK